ncbi:MAG TPA: PAS domain S-box protein [Beijerinckiaceae bacterium]
MRRRLESGSSAFDFLAHGGEMGVLIRAFDWASTPLGPIDEWPQALKTLVGVMLGSNQPMFVAWGPERALLYNDPYVKVLAGKHPTALSCNFLDVWSEIRADLVPIVAQAYAGEPVHMDDITLVMLRKGYLEETHFAFSYTPVRDETGEVAGFFCALNETTGQVLAEKRAAEVQERQRQMLRQMPGFVGMLSGPDLVYTYVNDAYVTISERTDFIGRRFRDVFADIEGQGFFEAFENAFRSGQSAVFRGMELRLHGRDDTQYVDFVLEPIRDESGTVTGLFVGGYETTEVYRGSEALRRSEARLAFLDRLGAETAPLADPDAVLATTTRLLGEHLSLSVCAYADMDEDEDGFTIRGDWAAPGSRSIVGHYSLADFGTLAVKNLSAGLPLVVNDNLRELAPEEAATFQSIGIAATICMPLVKEGRLTALMAIHDRVPRVWTEAELGLLREVTARSWAHIERVRSAADRERGQALIAAQSRVLECAVQDVPLADTLNAIVTTVEELSSSGVLASILLLDEDGMHLRHGAGPSLPTAYNAAIDGIRVGPGVGSCGTAVHLNAPVFVSDIATDPLWADFRELALSHDLRACWSIPIVSTQGSVLGTFALYHREPRAPAPVDLELVDVVVRTAGLVIERTRAEQALRTSEERLRLAAQAAQIGTWDLDLITGNGHWDEAALRISGLTEDSGLYDTYTWIRLVHPDDRERTGAAFLASLEPGGPAYDVEFRGAVPAEDGGTRWITSHGAVIRDPDTGKATRAVGIIRDATARHRQQERLRESEERLRLATESAEVGFWDVDVVNDVLIWPPRVKAMFGLSADVPVSMADFYTGLHPDDREATCAAFAAACDPVQRALYDVEYRTVGREDGVVRWVAAKGRGVFDDQGRCVRVIGTAIDVTARKRTEAALRDLNQTLEKRVAARTSELAESQRRFRGIFDSALQFMALLTPAGTVMEVNRTALSWSEIEPKDIVGKPFWLAAPMRGNPELQAAIKAGIERAAAGETVRDEHEMRGAGEARATVDFSLKPVPGERGEAVWLVAEGRDITELKRAQEQLRQAQKLEAVGQLTGGVAHDFNNLLTVIKSSTDLLRRPGLAEDRRRRYVDAISDTVDRASKLTGQLLAFARRQALKPEVFDPIQRIRSIAEMLRTIVGSRIEIAIEAGCETCFIEADASQFETALVNMAVNARDAMDGEGRLTVRVDEIAEMPAIRGQAASEGRFVAVSIADTGHGIPADQLGQIFEPFFTTKEVGRGTGLGLSQVFGFAKQSGGDVAVDSEVGRGTTFTLYLPQSGEERTHVAGASEPRGGLADEDGRGRRVLVVEDNVEVGRFSTQILQDLGYATTWAANADEALKLLADRDGFDAVFSDVVMPGMSGVELGQEIRRRYPGLPVVLTSGYSHVLAEEGRHGFELIKKPYAAEELSRVLRRVTASRKSGRT